MSSGAPIGADGTMGTPEGAAAPLDSVAGPSPSSPPSPLLAALGPDDDLQITIDRRLHDDHLEGDLLGLTDRTVRTGRKVRADRTDRADRAVGAIGTAPPLRGQITWNYS